MLKEKTIPLMEATLYFAMSGIGSDAEQSSFWQTRALQRIEKDTPDPMSALEVIAYTSHKKKFRDFLSENANSNLIQLVGVPVPHASLDADNGVELEKLRGIETTKVFAGTSVFDDLESIPSLYVEDGRLDFFCPLDGYELVPRSTHFMDVRIYAFRFFDLLNQSQGNLPLIEKLLKAAGKNLKMPPRKATRPGARGKAREIYRMLKDPAFRKTLDGNRPDDLGDSPLAINICEYAQASGKFPTLLAVQPQTVKRARENAQGDQWV